MADHNLRANGYALYNTAVFGQEQYGGHVQSEVELSTPNLVIHILSRQAAAQDAARLHLPGRQLLRRLLAAGGGP